MLATPTTITLRELLRKVWLFHTRLERKALQLAACRLLWSEKRSLDTWEQNVLRQIEGGKLDLQSPELLWLWDRYPRIRTWVISTQAPILDELRAQWQRAYLKAGGTLKDFRCGKQFWVFVVESVTAGLKDALLEYAEASWNIDDEKQSKIGVDPLERFCNQLVAGTAPTSDRLSRELERFDREGLTAKLLADLWHLYPIEAQEAKLPTPTEKPTGEVATTKPAWKRLKIITQTGGDDIAELDGKQYRLKSKQADFLRALQEAEGNMVLAQTLKDTLHKRADHVYSTLHGDLKRIIDAPGKDGTGYRML